MNRKHPFISTVLYTTALLVLVCTSAQARPRYARAEGKSCAYCHVNPSGGGDRNYRGIFYEFNGLTFDGFDDAAEAKKAGVSVGPDATPPPKSYKPPVAAKPLPPNTANPQQVPDFGTVIFEGIEFVKIPPGSFQRGTADAQRKLLETAGAWIAGNRDEQPARTIRISKGFLLSKYEITQAQWKMFASGKDKKNPAAFKESADNPNLPVESVSWDDAQNFCRALQQKSGGNSKYRLPTEAEWEYAARAGSTDMFGAGKSGAVTPDSLKDFAWYSVNSGNKTHSVGTKGANAWGLCDMLGNVWEWCEDAYSPTFYAESPDTDPVCRPAVVAERVLRGGCWFLDYRAQRVGLRGGSLPTTRNSYFGFRIVREL